MRRLGEAMRAVLSPKPLNEDVGTEPTRWALVSLPPALLDETWADPAAPDPALSAVLDGTPLPATGRHGRVIAVAATGAERAARLAFKLARLAQQEGEDTLFVDAKLGCGHGPLRGSSQPSGLADYLTGSSPLDAILRRDKANGLAILPAGYIPLPASTLLSAPPWRSAVMRLRRRFRTTVLVAPSVGEDGFSDIARRADGVVILIDRRAAPAYLEDRAELVTRVAPRATLFIALV